MVGLTVFTELAAAIACGGLALSLAELAGVPKRLTIAGVGASAGFFIGFVTQLGLPMLALPVAVVAVSGLERWIALQSTAPISTHELVPVSRHPSR
ncbi:MAG TPA: hypothetical protein VND54_06235 [Candidatus Saccharimonadales bacterium]|nr:hypothetical protein [Candidatus Saccharimonadales bacterium]